MMTRIFFFVLLTLIFASCGNKDSVKIKGTFSGLPDKTIFLDRITTSRIFPVDSTKTDSKGRFCFRLKLKNETPAFYVVRHGGQSITLLLNGGESVELNSLGNISNNYIVAGSEGSERIKDLSTMMLAARYTMDSLSRLYGAVPDPDQDRRLAILGEYTQIYITQKRDMIKFIVENTTSLASIFALYQRMPNGESIFSGKEDMLYFKTVADSLSTRYPSSEHVMSLQKDLLQMEHSREMGDLLSKAQSADVTFPDIELPNMYGKKVKLSSLLGKVILLDFWSPRAPDSRMDNAELKALYNDYADNGFEVYQVSLDESKPLWVSTVQEQKLPWVSVNDFKGANSPAARMYNITSLPTNFLINKDGNIVSKNISVAALRDILNEAL